MTGRLITVERSGSQTNSHVTILIGVVRECPLLRGQADLGLQKAIMPVTADQSARIWLWNYELLDNSYVWKMPAP